MDFKKGVFESWAPICRRTEFFKIDEDDDWEDEDFEDDEDGGDDDEEEEF